MTEDIRYQIELVVTGLEELSQRVVFVGGCLPVFYVDQERFEEPRPTEDIDCIIELVTRSAHHELEESLRKKGFENEPSMIARWTYKGIIVDIMPIDERILGFSNRWYSAACKSPKKALLPDGGSCNILSVPYFFATKFEALSNRGGDLRMSKDLEDILYVLNGCPSVVEEISSSEQGVQNYIAEELSKLSAFKNFDELLEAHLSRANKRRKEIIIEQIRMLASR